MLHPEIDDAATRAMHSVDGRVIIVTGSGQGVGRGMAHHLGKAGASVVVADYQAVKMQRTCDELSSIGVENLGVEVDIRDRERIDAMVAATVERFGRVRRDREQRADLPRRMPRWRT